MSETPTKVVVDCGRPDKDTFRAQTEARIADAVELARAGTLTPEQADTVVRNLLDRAAAVLSGPDRVLTLPLDDVELAQRELDAAAALEQAWVDLRAQRNGRLDGCDWTQLPDAPLDEQARAAWVEYRQALRDLPAATRDPRDPAWPAPPA